MGRLGQLHGILLRLSHAAIAEYARRGRKCRQNEQRSRRPAAHGRILSGDTFGLVRAAKTCRQVGDYADSVATHFPRHIFPEELPVLFRNRLTLALVACLFWQTLAWTSEPDSRVFEMRTYYASPGKLDALETRFRDHTTRLFEKH